MHEIEITENFLKVVIAIMVKYEEAVNEIEIPPEHVDLHKRYCMENAVTELQSLIGSTLRVHTT